MRLQPFLNVVVLVSLVFSTVGPSAPAQAARGGDATHAGDDSPRPGPVPTGAEAGSDALEANQILITETGFSPDVLTVTVGSQVTWLNTTGQTHVLVSGQPERIYLPIILKQAGQAAASGSGANEPPPQAGLTADEDFRVSIPPGETFAHTFTSAGVHNYYLATAPQFTGQVICQAGPGSLTVTLSAQPASGVVPLSVDLAATVSNVAGGVLTYTWEYGDSITDTMPATTSLEVTASHFYPLVGSYPVTVTVSDAEASASAQQTITVTPHSVALPPDPADVAPDLDRTVATTMVAATEFLYAGDPPIQTGVAPGAIDPQRVAVLRGRVLDREDTPLSGVTISILNRPEFGQTLSRADGMFDLAVNGGGPLTIHYAKPGYLTAQRQLDVPWQDYVWAPDVILIPVDSQVTKIDLTSSTEGFAVAQGSLIADDDGTRQATLLVPGGAGAELVLPDGSTQPLDSLTVRATEFTVGDNGPEAMPAELPPTSGYTYAAEFSADEALAAGATDVQFDQPLYFYVEDFIGFPVGSAVPTGYYDKAAGQWVASENGRVVEILSISGGLADLDTDGDGLADNGEVVTPTMALTITTAEREKLAGLYPQPPQRLWRVPVEHFTPYDCNWPYGPPEDATGPNQPDPEGDDPEDDACENGGSIIECQNQILGERVPLVGTPYTLNYRSDRAAGRKAAYSLRIPLSGDTIPASLDAIRLKISMAGRQMVNQDFPPQTNQSYTFTWDGRDAYDRPMQGRQPIVVRIGYVYEPVYYPVQSEWERSFSRFRGISASRSSGGGGGGSTDYSPISGGRRSNEIVIWQTWKGGIGAWDARAQGLGGWSLDVHHAYNPLDRTLYLGDGTRRSADNIDLVISTVAGTGESGYNGDDQPATEANISPNGVAAAPDGSFYVADGGSNRIRHVDPDGIITTVAGNGIYGYGGDGGPATQAKLASPEGISLAPDGSLYIAELANNRVRCVSPDGIITTVAGNGSQGYSGDGGPATEAQLNWPRDVAVAPDGSLYIGDDNNNRVRRVGLDGIITTVAGDGQGCYAGGAACGDGGPATEAQLNFDGRIALALDGSLYIADTYDNRIRRVSPDGIITTVAGNGIRGYYGEGIPATEAQLNWPRDVAVAPDGSLYIADRSNRRVRYVSPQGTIYTLAGSGIGGYARDGGPATRVPLGAIDSIDLSTRNTVLIADWSYDNVQEIRYALQGYSPVDIVIPSEDGSQLLHFDPNGRHLRTLHALTGATLYEFGYDGAGRLLTVTDGDDNVTTVERDGEGRPTAIVGPYGQRTTLSLDGNGYLESITNPASETHAFSYTEDGLLTDRSDPRDHDYHYTYDDLGRLVRADDPAGGFKTLTRTDFHRGYEVALTTAEGRTTSYRVERLPTGQKRLVNTFPGGQSNEVLIGTDGSRTVTYADGTVVAQVEGPDPRWGMLAPIQQSLVISTPAGLESGMAMTRTATLADPADPLTLGTQTDEISLNGRTYSVVFDAASRQTTTTSPEGRQLFSTIDDQGRPIREEVAGLPYPDQYSYDGQGRLETFTAGPGDDPAVDRIYEFGYDPQGYLASLTNPLGHSTHFAYDDAGRPTVQTLPDDRHISYSYDANGNLSTLTPPGRPAHAFTYTPVDLTESYAPPALLDVPDPDTNYAYNLDRELEEVSRPDGLTLDPEYDATTGRLRQVTLPGERAIEFDYYDGDPPGEPDTGQVRQITSQPENDSLTYTYDGSLPTGKTWAGTIQGGVGWVYDDDFRVRAQTINSADFFNAAFSYDDDGLLNAVNSSMPGLPLSAEFSVTRHPEHGLVTATRLENVTTSRTYNGFGELATASAALGGMPLYEVSYHTAAAPRDKLGRITDLTETVLGVTTSTHYEYDQAGRLTDVWRDGDHVSHYGYDPNGNRITHTHPISGTGLTPADIVYDDQDRLLQYGTKTYTYTANGELVAMTEDGQTTGYAYDVLGNLRAAILPNGRTIEYVIDGRNRRVGKKVDGVLEQGFLYQDQLNPVAELDGANDVVSVFVYGSRAHVPDYMLSKKGDGSTWVVYRILADHLGSPRLVVNATTGQVVQWLDYDEFGNVVGNTNPGFQPFGFAGGIYDPHTEFTRFGARDYDAHTGRWTTKDPVLFFREVVINPYAYVRNDPVNHMDPDGLRLWYANRESEEEFRDDIEIIMSTPVGRKLLKLLHESSVTFYIKEVSWPGPGYAILNSCFINPSSHPPIWTDQGSKPISTTRTLAHELGHLAQQFDTGPKEYPNMKDWENPIMFPLEGYKRLLY